MPRVVYYVASSVDGFLAPTDGSLDWLAPFSGTGEDHGYTAFYTEVDALVVGARTYEQMLGFGEWPHNDRPVTVMSSRSLPADSDTITVTPSGPREVVAALAREGHRIIWLVGGGELAGSFADAGLIDEYIVSYLPVVLGSGRGLLGGHAEKRELELVESHVFDDGIVQCRYRSVAP